MGSQSGRMAYDFSSLAHNEFEDLARDLVGREIGKRFEPFPEGPDDAMDGRHALAERVEFDRLRSQLPAAPASLANSSGIFLGEHYHHNVVRPGAALYAINPTPASSNPMLPVVSLQAKVIQTGAVPAGNLPSYLKQEWTMVGWLRFIDHFETDHCGLVADQHVVSKLSTLRVV